MAANLPDVFLFSVFRKLGANDRLSACQVCTNWYHRVRSVNQATVHCLTITVGIPLVGQGYFIDEHTFGYSRKVKQQLMKEAEMRRNADDADDDVDPEKLECSTIFNTLQFFNAGTDTDAADYSPGQPQLNSTTVGLIMDVFPATIELNIINKSDIPRYEYLVQMLTSADGDHDDDDDESSGNGWSKQLTALRLIDLRECDSDVRFKATRMSSYPLPPHDAIWKASRKTNRRLFKAINRLPALRRLALVPENGKFGLRLEKLPVLARLREVRLGQAWINRDDMRVFLRSLDQYAAGNERLLIDLPTAGQLREMMNPNLKVYKNFIPGNSFCSQLQRRVVRAHTASISWEKLASFGSFFYRLTSLAVDLYPTDVTATSFRTISQHLPHLLHLKLNFNFANGGYGGNGLHPPLITPSSSPSSFCMASVRALELSLQMTTHDDLQWLSLPLIMPNLAIIHFTEYQCSKCHTYSRGYLDPEDRLNTTHASRRAAFRSCFGAVLPQLSTSTGLSLEQITFELYEEDDVNPLSARHVLL